VDSWEKYRPVDETLHHIVYFGIAQCSDYFLELHDFNLPQQSKRQTGLTSLCRYRERKRLGRITDMP
jgi:hypothetical protein